MEENITELGSPGLLADLSKVKPYTVDLDAHKVFIKELLRRPKKIRMIWSGKLKRYVEYKPKR